MEEAEAQRAEHDSEITSCGGSRQTLEQQVQVLEQEVGQLGGVLERVGGEEGIKELVSAAAAAKQGAAAAKEQEEASRRNEKMVSEREGGGGGGVLICCLS